jgi:hypothetical protein
MVKIPMRFEARVLKPYAEPVDEHTLKVGEVYFALNFADEEMLIPTLQTVVFVGRNLEPGDDHRIYFQDIDSFQRGVRRSTASADDYARFEVGDEGTAKHIFEFEYALDGLLACALRRKKAGK